MRNKKLAAIPLLIAIALSMSGFAYAHWSDTVTIEGTVHMGSLTIAWDENTKLAWVDNEDDLPVPKDIADAEFYYDEKSYFVDEHTGKGGYKVIIINITNAYPQYKVDFTTLVANNTGTVPAHFVDIILEGYDETDDEPLKFEWKADYEHEIGWFWDNGDDDTWGTADDVKIINVEFVDFVCTQLDPCHKTKGEIDLEFKQDAEECHTYTFTVEIVAVQWNKA